MANSEAVVRISLPVAADYSAAQYRIVNVNASGQAVLVSSAGGQAIGVLYNNPAAAGRAGTVVIAGVAKVVLGATVAAGAKVQSDANGAAITALSADHVVGICVAGGDSGEIGEILVNVAPPVLA